jgi:hypothetical protein
MASVDEARRHAAVAALVQLATSDDYRDRADAGCALANFVQVTEAQESLRRLVLDPHDTLVTRETAEALLRRQDAAGFAVVAGALASADFQHSTSIHDAVRAVFMVFASERDLAMEACGVLSLDGNAQIRQGAADLRAMLARIEPVLFPQEPA